MSNNKRIGEITGKISAKPNPVAFLQGSVEISWETNDPAGGEVRVSTSPDHEQLVSRGQSGRTKISWIEHSKVYEFRLYPASRPELPIASLEPKRETQSTQPFSPQLPRHGILLPRTRRLSHAWKRRGRTIKLHRRDRSSLR